MDSNGNPAAMMYAIRTGSQGFNVPIDNEVVYGKIGSLGYLFHAFLISTTQPVTISFPFLSNIFNSSLSLTSDYIIHFIV